MTQMTEAKKGKKFYPRFEPQHVQVIAQDPADKQSHRALMVTDIQYTADFIRVFVADDRRTP